jgi:hypothetical protein
MSRYPSLKFYKTYLVGLLLQVQTDKDPQEAVVTTYQASFLAQAIQQAYHF